ncbi:MAG: hypothetical protein EAZ08_04255 [Cytophagales bacterium]|nr:MAG: hypothetical protein EAZ08_04255 [Cytophagales bacterium]
MPINSKYLAHLESGKFYHIYNRAVAKNLLFFNDGNYTHFLKKYDEYFSDYAEMYAYCLLPNHFHFLVRIKEDFWNKNEKCLTFQKKYAEQNENDFLVKQMQNFFISYAMGVNKQQNRKGNLLLHPFKRVLVDSDAYFSRLIYYIHRNPVHHRLAQHYKNYVWSSYQRILNDKPTKLEKKAVLEWFGGKETYQQFHTELQDLSSIEHLLIEED